MNINRLASSPLSDWGAIVVALVAALALAVTVIVAHGDMGELASETVRGEGESLIARLHESAHGPPSTEVLTRQLAQLEGAGLRFVAFRGLGLALSAGTSSIAGDDLPAGSLVIRKGRALLVSQVARPGPPPPPPAALPLGPPPPPHFPAAGPPHPFPRPPPDAAILIEFEPRLVPRLEAGTNRTTVVGVAAIVVLLAFATASSVRAAGRAENARRAEQERRLVALGQMASVMAHELRNPLASLKGNAQLLVEMLAAATRERRKAELVVRESERLERLTEDLLAFVRDGALCREPVATAALVERSVAALDPQRVQVDLTEAPAKLWVDGARIAVALGNLVRNALQSSDAAAPVQVRVYPLGDQVCIDVKDDGSGIAPGDEDRIFEPFFTRRVNGTGLGLAVARRAVEQHGGTLTCQPVKSGATFRMLLPVGESTHGSQG